MSADDRELDERLEVAVAAAHEAGRVLLRRFEGTLHIETKSTAVDLVTEADREAEAVVLEQLRTRLPGDGIVAEESGEVTRAQGPCWYVDPLDGTTNFAHRFPHFSVSMGLHDGDQGLVGVVHDPCRGETFVARRGGGAWLRTRDGGERRLWVTEVDALQRSLLATGFGYDRAQGANVAEFSYLVRRVRGIRRAGSAALDLSWVAAGRMDGYWEYLLQPWDWAAGAVLVREAGGVVQTMEGGPFSLRGPSVCVSGKALHPVLLDALRRVREGDVDEPVAG